MSKSVRLKDHLAAEIDRLATTERRSLTNMVELLLEQALRLREENVAVTGVGWKDIPSTVPSTTSVGAADPHFHPDPK
jgi:predicted transcriptional regulator